MIWSAKGTRDMDFYEVVIWSNFVARDIEIPSDFVIIKRNEAASSLVSE